MPTSTTDLRAHSASFSRFFDHDWAAEAPRHAREAAAELGAAGAEAAGHLEEFAAHMEGLDPARRVELFSRTFDLMPSCAPYLSVHLFGEESFKRAMLMTGLAAAYEREGFDRGGELPDHLGVVLRFASRFGDQEWDEFARLCLPTPLVRMRALLDPADNPYRHVVAALQSLLASEFVPEVLPCSTPSSSAPYLTSPCSSCASAPSGGTDGTASATPPCRPSFSRTASSSGAPSRGTRESW